MPANCAFDFRFGRILTGQHNVLATRSLISGANWPLIVMINSRDFHDETVWEEGTLTLSTIRWSKSQTANQGPMQVNPLHGSRHSSGVQPQTSPLTETRPSELLFVRTSSAPPSSTVDFRRQFLKGLHTDTSANW
jgi:hypothetical protein